MSNQTVRWLKHTLLCDIHQFYASSDVAIAAFEEAFVRLHPGDTLIIVRPTLIRVLLVSKQHPRRDVGSILQFVVRS